MNKNKIKLHNPVRTFALAGLVFFILVPQSSSSVEPDSGNVKKEISEIASRIVSKMTDEEKIGQVIHISIPENFLDEIAIAEIEKIKPGGIILFGKNMGTKDEIRDLTKSLQSEMKKKDLPPLLISTDQEGGRVIRAKKGVTEFPGAMATGQTGNKSFAYSIGKITSFQLNSLGINLLLAPVMDINNNPENPVINTRSYGSTLGTVSDFATLYELGAREGGAIPVIKHFPGHGDTNIDSHLGLPLINRTEEELLKFELLPFQKSIESGAKVVMSAHIVYPKLDPKFPATLSRRILTGILRDKLKFQGLVMTDAMEMNAISKNYMNDLPGILAIQSGADVILLTSWGETTSLYKEMLLSGIKSGSFLKDGTNLLDEAVKKQIELKIQSGIMHSDFRGIKIETPVIGRHLANRGKRIKETAREIERLNPEKLNETISYYSIRSYKKEFSPLSQPEFKKYRSFVKELYLARELRNLNIKTEKFSKLAKALKSKNSKYFIIDSVKPEDLEKISKIITQNPKKNFILLHYGSPFLDFPKTDNVAILLSFSPTEGSLRALVKRAFNPGTKSLIRPADLILK